MQRRLTKFYCLKKWFFCLFLFLFFYFSVVLTKEFSLGVCSEAGWGGVSKSCGLALAGCGAHQTGVCWLTPWSLLRLPAVAGSLREGLLAPQERPTALSLFLKHVFAGRLELDRLEGIICSFQSIFLCLTSRYGRRPAFIFKEASTSLSL